MTGIMDNYDSHYPLRVGLVFQNRGSVDAILVITVTVTNADIAVDEHEPWIFGNGTQINFYVGAPMHMQSVRTEYVNILPVGNPQNFTITYSYAEGSAISSIKGLISHLFLEPHGYSPTFAVYNRTDMNLYQLLK